MTPADHPETDPSSSYDASGWGKNDLIMMTQGGYDDKDNVGESVAQSNSIGSRTETMDGWLSIPRC